MVKEQQQANRLCFAFLDFRKTSNNGKQKLDSRNPGTTKEPCLVKVSHHLAEKYEGSNQKQAIALARQHCTKKAQCRSLSVIIICQILFKLRIFQSF